MDVKKLIAMSLTMGLGTLAVVDCNKTADVYAESTAVLNLGDINNDGLINAVDSTLILTEYALLSTDGVGNFSEEQKKAADINNDNIVDSVDATFVLSYYAYKSTGGALDFEKWLENPEEKTTTTTTTQSTETTTSSVTETTTTTTVAGYTASLDTSVSAQTTTGTSTVQTTATTTTAATVTTTTVTSQTDGKISEIRLSKYEMNLNIGEKDISYVTMLPAEVENKDEIWTSSDENVATVDMWGNVTALADGTCTVTVTSVDNPEVKAEIKVTVGNHITEIKLSKYEMNLNVGEKDISYVTMLPAEIANKDEIWTTSDENVATVDMWGNVTALADGTCTVTVTSVDNPEVKAEIKVTVGNPVTENRITEIKLSKYEMNLNVGEKDISYVTMLPAEVENKDEIWTTSDENVATVDMWGNVTALAAGTCTVTVTSVDNPEVKAEIKVTVGNPVTDKQATFQQINGLTYINGILIANKSYALPESYDPGIDSTTVNQFGELSSAAAKEGLDIYLSSGYRSYSYQSTIYNNYVSWYGKAVADTFSARPGHSEHQTGFAIDVNTVDDSFAGTPEAVWLAEHAHEYGFIIRYPEGKECITGYKYEPWHIRYLGVEKATEIYNSGLTLEEYLGIDSYYH